MGRFDGWREGAMDGWTGGEQWIGWIDSIEGGMAWMDVGMKGGMEGGLFGWIHRGIYG